MFTFLTSLRTILGRNNHSDIILMKEYKIDATIQQCFEDWGTSLCWWASAIKWSDDSKSKLADLIFSLPPFGLGLTAARYNIGGGDDDSCEYGDHFRPGGDIPSTMMNLNLRMGQRY